ncbi:MAG: zeta toxin family protein [Betaproteobacteria bacterium]
MNSDDIEKEIRTQGRLNVTKYGIDASPQEFETHFRDSAFLQSAGLGDAVQKLRVSRDTLDFAGVDVNSYFASAAVDFIRQKLLQAGASFTFETVMSHRSKVELLARSQAVGYRTYLYYIATDDPAINVSRVRNRVKLGGHAVPEDKIVSRYYRSLDLLLEAIRYSNRAYVFDNSGEHKENTWLAEVTDGKLLVMHQAQVPAWFTRAVLDKLK